MTAKVNSARPSVSGRPALTVLTHTFFLLTLSKELKAHVHGIKKENQCIKIYEKFDINPAKCTLSHPLKFSNKLSSHPILREAKPYESRCFFRKIF